MSETFIWNGVEYRLPTRDGLIFRSKAAAHRLHVRPRRPIYEFGVLVGEERELTADFGDQDAPVVYDEDGTPHVEIRGHFCHTKIQGEQKGWTDEERALVEKKLLATQKPNIHWLHTKPPVGKPWPTYDETAAGKIAELASALGLVNEAIAYERENKNRKTVLEALKDAAPAAESVEAEEIAAV